MTSNVKTIAKFVSLSIILSSFVFGLYAQNKFSNYLATNSKTTKYKTMPKTNTTNNKNLAILEEKEIVEEKCIIENWMLDDKFWELTNKFEWDKEPVEEQREIEDWMYKFKIQRVGCVDIYSDFAEKEWMKEHSFFIL